ncbi:MAG TPA: glycosyltransferase family 39 protein [Candidatus Eisenbacteria bacterium]|nr:glycosyltransferase family 39 protein [Candidatus Eisenbacteria bacterium]
MATPARRGGRASKGKPERSKAQATSGSPGASYRWTRWIAYSAIAVFAVYWGVKAFAVHRIGNYGVETDFYWKYGSAARDLLHGRIDIANYDSKGWGYPAAVALVSLLGLDTFRAAQVLALLSAVAAAALAYRLHRSLLGPGVALASLLLLLGNHSFLINTYEVGTDMFFFAIVLGSIALLLRRSNPSAKVILASGLLGGWAFSTRYNGLFLWPGALMLLLLVRTAEGPAAVRLRRAGVWTAGFVAAALPWLIINAVHTGNPLTNSNYINVGYAIYGEGNWDKYFYGGGHKIGSFLDIVRQDPGRFASVMVKNTFDHLGRDMSELIPPAWAIIAVCGGVILLIERPGRRVAGYALLWVLYFLTLIPVFYGARFSLPLLAFWFLLAAWPFVSPALGKRIAGVERAFPLRTVVFLALWLPTVANAYQWTEDPANKERVNVGPYELLPVVDFLREQGPGQALLARKPHAAFMAKMRFVPIPEVDSPAEIRVYALKEHVRFLLVSGIELRMRAQGIRPFWSEAGVPGFARVFESPKALVYEVLPDKSGAQAP